MTNLPRRPRLGRRGAAVAAAAVLFGASTVAAAALALSAARADDWPTLRGNDLRSGVADEKLEPPLSLLWRYTGGRLGNNSAAASIVGNTAYFAGRAQNDAAAGGVLFAVDTKTGARKWAFPGEHGLQNKALFTTAPTVFDGNVYIGATDGSLYMIDGSTGREIRRFRTGATVASTPLVVKINDKNVLFFGANDKKFYALDPETGASSWRSIYNAGDNVNSAPIYADGNVYFTTADQKLHAVNAISGRPRYALRLLFRFLPNAPLYADSTLYIPSGPRLTALLPGSGNQRWARDLPGDILTPPVAADGIIYAACRNSRTQDYELYALRANGRELWKKAAVLPFAPSAAPTISGDVIYVPTGRNVLLAVSREDGHVLWQYRIDPSSSSPGAAPTGDLRLSAPVSISNGTLYVLSDDGSLSAFRKDAPDQTGPLLSVIYPMPGQAVNGGPGLVLAAKVTDPGSGLDDSSLQMMLDDQKVEPSFDLTRNMVYYQTKSKGKIVETATIPNGRHTVTIVAKDYKGNEQKETWSFVVDNGLPRPSSSVAPPPRPGGIGSGGNPRPGGGPGGGNPRPGGLGGGRGF